MLRFQLTALFPSFMHERLVSNFQSIGHPSNSRFIRSLFTFFDSVCICLQSDDVWLRLFENGPLVILAKYIYVFVTSIEEPTSFLLSSHRGTRKKKSMKELISVIETTKNVTNFFFSE